MGCEVGELTISHEFLILQSVTHTHIKISPNKKPPQKNKKKDFLINPMSNKKDPHQELIFQELISSSSSN